MRFLLAPDKFKGTLSAKQVCEAMCRGIHAVDSSIEVVQHPLADGGEGTSDLLELALGLVRERLEVHDPLFRPVSAHYLRNESMSFIEMAHASGLQLLEPSERNALKTTTYGTGELIRHALDQGVSEVYLMIGGSATNDAGIGMAMALGYEFGHNLGGKFRPTGGSVRNIQEVSKDQMHQRIQEVKFTVLCDVQNPLLGPNGASHVYGPQKGADEQEVISLDNGLGHLARLLDNGFEGVPGAGAAGGLGYGAMSFLGAELKPGIQTVMEMMDFDKHLADTDLIITGEGKMDLQTVEGKVIAGVSEKALERKIPFAVICGMAEEKARVQAQIKAWQIAPLVNEEVDVKTALENAYALVKQRASEITEAFLDARDSH